MKKVTALISLLLLLLFCLVSTSDELAKEVQNQDTVQKDGLDPSLPVESEDDEDDEDDEEDSDEDDFEAYDDDDGNNTNAAGTLTHLRLLFRNHRGFDFRDWDMLSTQPKMKQYPRGLGVQHCFNGLPYFFRLWPVPFSLHEQVQPVMSWNSQLIEYFGSQRNATEIKQKDIFGSSPAWKSGKFLPYEKYNYFISQAAWGTKQPLALPSKDILCAHSDTTPCEVSLPSTNSEIITATTTKQGSENLLENAMASLLQTATKVIADILLVHPNNVSIRLNDAWVNIDKKGQQQNPRSNHDHLHHIPRSFNPSDSQNETLEVTTDWTLLYVLQSNGFVKNKELFFTDPRIQAGVLERGVFDTYDQGFFLHEGSLFAVPASIPYSIYVNSGVRERIVMTILATTRTKVPAKPLDSCYTCPPRRKGVKKQTSVVHSGPRGSDRVAANKAKKKDSISNPPAPSSSLPISKFNTSTSGAPLTSTLLVHGEQIAVATREKRVPLPGAVYHWHRWHTGVLQYALPSRKQEFINECLTNYSMQLLAENDGIYLSNYGGYHSKTDIWEKESTAPADFQRCLNIVRDYAYHAVSLYLQHSMYPIATQYPKNKRDEIAWQIDVTNAWINVNGRTHFNVPHIHPGTVVSGVYYIDHGGDECSSLYFENPFHSPIHQFEYLGQDARQDIGKAYMNDNHLAIHSVPGTYLIFPSWLQHYTLPHHCPNVTETANSSPSSTSVPTPPSSASKTGCRRISIAFNVYVEKNQWGDTWCTKEELKSKWCIIYPTRHRMTKDDFTNQEIPPQIN